MGVVMRPNTVGHRYVVGVVLVGVVLVGAACGGGSAQNTAASSPSKSPSKVPLPSPSAMQIPDGWTLHTDPEGFTIATPPGWRDVTSQAPVRSMTFAAAPRDTSAMVMVAVFPEELNVDQGLEAISQGARADGDRAVKNIQGTTADGPISGVSHVMSDGKYHEICYVTTGGGHTYTIFFFDHVIRGEDPAETLDAILATFRLQAVPSQSPASNSTTVTAAGCPTVVTWVDELMTNGPPLAARPFTSDAQTKTAFGPMREYLSAHPYPETAECTLSQFRTAAGESLGAEQAATAEEFIDQVCVATQQMMASGEPTVYPGKICTELAQAQLGIPPA